MIKVVETKFEQIDGDDTRLAFIGDDNKRYDAEFTSAARAQLLTLLQIDTAKRLEIDRTPLTVCGVSLLGSAVGFAVEIETAEAGPIAFHISADQRKALRQALADLEAQHEPPHMM